MNQADEFLFRLTHFDPQLQGYSCLPCKKRFSTWATFKRHREQVHSLRLACLCPYCSYKTSRKANLTRHLDSNHGSRKLVESLLRDILENVNSGKDILDGGEDDDEQDSFGITDQDQSVYVQMRNKRVAEIQAEFRKKFPNFDQDVRGLKVDRKKVRGRKKKAPKMTAAVTTRRSSRSVAPSRDENVVDSVAEAVTHDCQDSPPSDMHQGVQAAVTECGDRGVSVYTAAGDEVAAGEVAGDEASFGELAGEEAVADVGALGKYGCTVCNKGFRDIRNLRRHVSLVHQERSSPVACPRTWCSSEFTVLAEMIRHKKTCLLMCPYTGCRKTFKYENVLAAHKRGHLAMDRRMKD